MPSGAFKISCITLPAFSTRSFSFSCAKSGSARARARLRPNSARFIVPPSDFFRVIPGKVGARSRDRWAGGGCILPPESVIFQRKITPGNPGQPPLAMFDEFELVVGCRAAARAGFQVEYAPDAQLSTQGSARSPFERYRPPRSYLASLKRD